MKRLFATMAAVVLVLAGTALAANFDYGVRDASVMQTVTITIPTRVAIHITQSEFALDLNDLSGVTCYLVRKDLIETVDDFDSLVDAIVASGPHLVTAYPGVVLDGDGNVMVENGEFLKGGMACYNTKTVQKFVNSSLGWTLSADVSMNPGMGQFGILDDVDPWYVIDGLTPWFGHRYRHLLDSNDGIIRNVKLDDADLADQCLGRSDGWLDNYIYELFFFDGGERPGEKTMTVTFNLTGGW